MLRVSLALRLDGEELRSDLDQWSFEGGTCLKVQVSQVVLQLVETGKGWGKGARDPHPSLRCL